MSSCCKTPPTPSALSQRMGSSELFSGEQIVSAVSNQLKAEDLIFLPPKEVFQAEPHEAIAQSRERLKSRSEEGF